MSHWYRWGRANFDYRLPSTAMDYLRQRVGEGQPTREVSLPEFAPKIAKSRLSGHTLYTTDSETRIRFSAGHSFPDWVAMKSGTVESVPDAVAFPENREEVRQLLKLSAENRINLIPYGGGTSVVGHLTVPISDRPTITVSMGKMDRRLSLDRESRIALFQAGILGPKLEKSLNRDGFTLGHYPQSFELSSLGGWIASRSAGQFSLGYGRIERLLAGAIVETPTGSVELPFFPASAAGPDIKEMILGSEGRLGFIVECALKISKLPETQQFNGAFFPDTDSALSAVKEIARCGNSLAMIRLSFAEETETMLRLNRADWKIDLFQRYLTCKGIRQGKRCMMLYGSLGSKKEVGANIKAVRSVVKRWKGVDAGTRPGSQWYRKRFKLPYLRNTLWSIGYGIDTVETATAWNRVPDMVADLESAIGEAMPAKHEKVHVFTHLSHVYPQGSSVYTTYLFRLADTPQETLRRWRAMKRAASETIVRHRGTISHQHGVGLDHKPYLQSEKSENGLRLMQSLFETMDPHQTMNPGKLVDLRQDRRKPDP